MNVDIYFSEINAHVRLRVVVNFKFLSSFTEIEKCVKNNKKEKLKTYKSVARGQCQLRAAAIYQFSFRFGHASISERVAVVAVARPLACFAYSCWGNVRSFV